QLDQPVGLERLEVVVDLLTGDTDPGGQPGGGGRDGQLTEQPGPHRVQGGGGRLHALNDLDVLHRATVPLTKSSVKGVPRFATDRAAHRAVPTGSAVCPPGGRGPVASD